MKTKIIQTCIFSTILAISNLVLAHGEDKVGPHGGFVRMPGAFHTEVVISKKNAMKVFLLDMDWKNPSVLKSSVTAKVVAQSTEEVTCSVQKNYFLCTFSKNTHLKKKGQLLITAVREDQTGALASYDLPLKLEKKSTANEKKNEEKMDHSSHH